MRTLLWLLLCLVLTSPDIAAETLVCPEAPPEQYRTHNLTITFATRTEAKDLFAATFAKYELPGWILHGAYSGYDIKHMPWILVVVDDPSVYTMTYVNRLMTMLVELNTYPVKPLHVHYPMDFGSEAWDEAGILDHELAHASDATIWKGHQAAYIHHLFLATPAEPKGQPATNPWQVVFIWFPAEATHPGFDKRVYR